MEQTSTQHKEILDAVGSLAQKTDESIERLSQKTDESIERLSKKTDDLTQKTDDILGAVGEVLEAIGHFSNKTEERFEGVERRLDDIESNMVTKSYLDEKLSDLRGDLVVLTRKEDAKLLRLVDILETRQVISREDANMVMAMEPFPR